MAKDYSEGVKRVISAAQEEARQLRHEYIGTEHLLLALAGSAEGETGKLLKDQGITIESVRAEVMKVMRQGPVDVQIVGSMPQTPRAKQAVQYAEGLAQQMSDPVGIAHLLLGLLLDKHGVVRQVVLNLGVDVEAMQRSILAQFGGKVSTRFFETGVVAESEAERLHRVLKRAAMAAQMRGESSPRSTDVLLAMMEEGENLASVVLGRMGVGLIALQAEISRVSSQS